MIEPPLPALGGPMERRQLEGAEVPATRNESVHMPLPNLEYNLAPYAYIQ